MINNVLQIRFDMILFEKSNLNLLHDFMILIVVKDVEKQSYVENHNRKYAHKVIYELLNYNDRVIVDKVINAFSLLYVEHLFKDFHAIHQVNVNLVVDLIIFEMEH